MPDQASWSVFHPSIAVSMKVISVLRMQNFEMGEWLQLKKAGKNVGKIGVPLSDLWEWSLATGIDGNYLLSVTTALGVIAITPFWG